LAQLEEVGALLPVMGNSHNGDPGVVDLDVGMSYVLLSSFFPCV